jgi:hypothetical protein
MADNTDRATGNGIKLVLAWSFVGIPLVWGIYNTLLNALLLFK